MGLVVYGPGILGGVLASVVLTRYPEKMMKAAYLVTVTSTLTLAFFFYAAT